MSDRQDIEFATADDIFCKIVRFDPIHSSAGDQHRHAYEHISVVLGPFSVAMGDANGVPGDADLEFIGDVGQPSHIVIPAGKFHRFTSLRPGGLLLCISREHGGNGQQILEEAP